MNFRKLVPGIAIGVILVLVIQMVYGLYQDKKREASFARFSEGYNQASNKRSFVKNYDYSNRGLFDLSNSSASGDRQECNMLLADIEGMEVLIMDALGTGNEDMVRDARDFRNQLYDLYISKCGRSEAELE